MWTLLRPLIRILCIHTLVTGHGRPQVFSSCDSLTFLLLRIDAILQSSDEFLELTAEEIYISNIFF